MKTFKHESTNRFALNHRMACRGDAGRCPNCGRLMCIHCMTHDGDQFKEHLPGHAGECLICSGMYAVDEIMLNPPTWYWIDGERILLDENV